MRFCSFGLFYFALLCFVWKQSHRIAQATVELVSLIDPPTSATWLINKILNKTVTFGREVQGKIIMLHYMNLVEPQTLISLFWS